MSLERFGEPSPSFDDVTLVDTLRRRARQQPDQPAYTFIRDGLLDESHLTYGVLDEQARSIAAALQGLCAVGERALLIYPPGLNFIASFFGCLYAGVVPVPVYAPRPNRSAANFLAIAASAAASVVLTEAHALEHLSAERLAREIGLNLVLTDGYNASCAESWRPPRLTPSTLAFLQYTSGSTGAPKGVMVTHANLLHNQQLIQKTFQHLDQLTFISWLPHQHDMGLIGNIIHPLYIGTPCVFMSPLRFLQRPVSWLETITHYGAVLSGGPNFAYDLCANKITPAQKKGLDLTTWRIAYTGSEPIRAETLRRFSEAFGPCGFDASSFRSCYGLAEATLLVTGGDTGTLDGVRRFDADELTRGDAVDSTDALGATPAGELVKCGPNSGQRMVIVDAQENELPERRVGEIWIAGPSVAAGYWNQPEETSETFGARLAGSGEGPFLRTGDLGFLLDGQLYLSGRLKDLIVVRGRNYYPQDIERTVESSHPRLKPNGSAAFSVTSEGEERLVVVREVGRHVEGAQLDELIEAIRHSIALEYELEIYAVALVKTGGLPRTSSGKLRRSECGERFVKGTLPVVKQWRANTMPPTIKARPAATSAASRADRAATSQSFRGPSTRRANAVGKQHIEAWLVSRISERVNLLPEEIDIHRPFSYFGLSSVAAVEMAADLGEWLGRPLSPTLAWDYPTVEALSAYLGDSVSQTDSRTDGIAQSLQPEAVAVVGLGCRFPGARTLEEFWQLLRTGSDVIREIPPERWNLELFFNPNPDAPGKMYTRWGGFLDGADEFDPQFFGISPREAAQIDPQQRLLLEVTWEALEHAGIKPESVSGRQVGVFIGICSSDWAQLHAGNLNDINAYTGTGVAHSIAANRISYLFDFKGPSVAVDTACSSSLVAIHLACQSVRSGESEIAVAGGVNLILSPELYIIFSKARMMARDGRCKTFDAESDGYVRGEGCGVVILKRLSAALRDGDNILALVRGSAVNQDGRSKGLTAPNGESQQAVIRLALANASVSPEEVSYVEVHGTGTPLGDPIEFQALAKALTTDAARTQKCLIGSLKTNIGHLEGAAGIAGMIKVILALQKGEIPPHIKLNRINPRISLGASPLAIATELQAWPDDAGPRIAGVSSFGFGGTNSHVVLQEAPSQASATPSPNPPAERPLHLFTLSAKSERALKEYATRFGEHLGTHPELSLADVCYTVNTGRQHFEQRLAAIASSSQQLCEQLSAFTKGAGAGKLLRRDLNRSGKPKVAFLFTGQGAQYPGMGRQLYETQAVFREVIDTCARITNPHLDRPLLSLLYPEDETSTALSDTMYAQPAIFATEYALAEMWRSWGIVPDVVLGHSLGEFVAACVAEVFSLEEGLELIIQRSRLMHTVEHEGVMVAVLASHEHLAPLLAPFQNEVSVAAINSPENTVLSGLSGAMQVLSSELSARDIGVRPLPLTSAFHSHLLEPILADLEQAISKFHFAAPRIPIVSNLTGRLLEAGQTPDAPYWRRHAREAVRFSAGVRTLYEEGCRVFLELGPSTTLVGMGKSCLSDATVLWLHSLKQGQDDWSTVLNSLAVLYTHAAEVNWSGFDQGGKRRRVFLPTYPFEREQHGSASYDSFHGHAAKLKTARARAVPRHPMITRQLSSPHPMFECELSLQAFPFLADHCIEGAVLFPATAYLELVLAAAEAGGMGGAALEQVEFENPLFLPDTQKRTLQVSLSPDDEFTSFQIHSRTIKAEQMEEVWVLLAKGRVASRQPDNPPVIELQPTLEGIAALGWDEIAGSDLYRELQTRGFNYGPAFQGIEKLWRCDGQAWASLLVAPELEQEVGLYCMHPALLDASFHLLAATLRSPDSADKSGLFLPVGIEEVRVYAQPTPRLWCHARLRAGGEPGSFTLEGDINIFRDDGQPVAEVKGLRLQLIEPERGGRASASVENWFYQVQWQRKEHREPATAHMLSQDRGSWIIFDDRGGLGKEVAALLTEHEQRCVLVRPGQTFGNPFPDFFIVNPSLPDNMLRLFEAAVNLTGLPCRGLIHLWSLDAPPAEDTSPESLEAAQTLGCTSVLHLIQAVAGISLPQPPRLWLVTQGINEREERSASISVAQSPLLGLGRAIANELPELLCTCVDLCPDPEAKKAELLFREICVADGEDQICLDPTERRVARLVRISPTEAPAEGNGAEATGNGALVIPTDHPFRLETSAPGTLDNLTLRPAARIRPGAGQVEIEVSTVGLNFRDVMKAMGIYPSTFKDFQWLGDECAGRVVAVGEGVEDLCVGDEVIAVAPACFGKFATTSAVFVVPKPTQLTFEEAVTIPIAFMTAYYSLIHLARLSEGERVLIHAAAGGVGLAAVQVARQQGVEIFATAGSPEKREFLQSLGIIHVMDSRSLEFADEIAEVTGGKGVDVVINSLAGEAIPKSLAALGHHGRFVEIGKRDIFKNARLGLRPFQKNLSFFAVDMAGLFVERPEFAGGLFREVMRKFAEGAYAPLPLRTFPLTEVRDAFRWMAKAKNIGKIAVSVGGETGAPDDASRPQPAVRPDGAYLITGGLGNLGLLVARWLAQKGSRRLFLVGRSAPTAAARQDIETLKAAGVDIAVRQVDVADREQLVRLFEEMSEAGVKLRGVVHAAGLLMDGALLQLDQQRLRAVLAPKVQGAWNLHTLTLDAPLDFFVLFSSVASVIGSPGQGNYAAANAFLDALAHHRRAHGLPAMSINWGPWAEVGMAVRGDPKARLTQRGIESIPPQRGLEALAKLLELDLTQVIAISVNWPQFRRLYPARRIPALLSELMSGEGAEAATERRSLNLELLMAVEPGERRQALAAYIQKEVACVLEIEPSRLDLNQSLGLVGLDSLMSIEMKNRLEIDLGVTVPMILLMQGPSVSQLAGELLKLLSESASSAPGELAGGEAGAGDVHVIDALNQTTAQRLLTNLEQLSEAEVDSLLSYMLVNEEPAQAPPKDSPE